ncbi:hypothetical protein ABH313_18440 [Chromobacterium vaccinii]|uniref:hypothetical protein n=1 Tax=Chromobacterium vaccinii TaxID=1108595 RepID=UPI0032610678
MNSPKLAIDTLISISNEAAKARTMADKAALYSAARHLLSDLEAHVDEYLHGHVYLHEKLTSARWHIGAMLGFDITNGHDIDTHHVWALGELQTAGDNLPDER